MEWIFHGENVVSSNDIYAKFFEILETVVCSRLPLGNHGKHCEFYIIYRKQHLPRVQMLTA